MKTENLLKEMATRTGASRVILLLLACSIITNMFLAVKIATDKTIVQTHLVPPEIRRTLTLSNIELSREYLEEMAPYHAYLLLNATPQTVEYNNTQLLKTTAAEYRGALEKELAINAKWIKKNNVSTYYSAVRASGDPNDNTVKLSGRFEVQASGKIIETRTRDLVLSYRNQGGRIELISIKESSNPNQANAPQAAAASSAVETVTVDQVQKEYKGGASHD